MQRLASTGRRLVAWSAAIAFATTGVWACGDETIDQTCEGPDCAPVGMGGAAATTNGVGGVTTGPDGPSGLVADFSLTDVNSTSNTAGEPVSPRDYLEQVSAWYFAHAT